MKHFKIIGPKTTREFDIEDDEMIQWELWKMKEFEEKVDFKDHTYVKEQNEKIYPTETV